MNDDPATVFAPDCENLLMTIERAVPVDQAADLVRLLYRAFLAREPSEEDIVKHSEHLHLDGTMVTVSGIVYSQEAIAERERKLESPLPVPLEGMMSIGRADIAEVVTRSLAAVRRDPPSAYEVELRVDDFGRGTQLAVVLDDTFRTSPPVAEPAEDSASIDQMIEVMYRLALGRAPGPIDFEVWRAAAVSGPLSNVIIGIGESPEAKSLRAPLDMEPGAKVQLAFEIVLGRGATAAEVDTFRAMTGEGGWDISTLVWRLFTDEAKNRLLPPSPANNPQQAYIFGSRGLVSVADWRLAAETTATAADHDTLGFGSVVRLDPPGASPDNCVVSIITSLYRGGAFIRSFLDNITSQTIFRTHCELIIIDANSPEGEKAVVEEYCQNFTNIVYRRMETRIGIYEAWNIAVGMARGRYITNANLDDSRRTDSLEIQAATLDTFEFVDVAYQDVLYSFEPRLAFDTIAQSNIRTDLPIVSRYNLMEFNHPHNAPMWRASLHRDVGPFNQSLQSAADFEFWLRCRAAGKTFYKINEAHAAYFVNPDGISTRPDTRGVVEANTVSRDLFRKLVSPMLVISHDEFLARVDGIQAATLRSGRRYDIVQSALIALGMNNQGIAA